METQQDMMDIDSVDDNTRKSDDGIGESNSNKTGNSQLSANNEISLSSSLSSYSADAKFSSDSPAKREDDPKIKQRKLTKRRSRMIAFKIAQN